MRKAEVEKALIGSDLWKKHNEEKLINLGVSRASAKHTVNAALDFDKPDEAIKHICSAVKEMQKIAYRYTARRLEVNMEAGKD